MSCEEERKPGVLLLAQYTQGPEMFASVVLLEEKDNAIVWRNLSFSVEVQAVVKEETLSTEERRLLKEDKYSFPCAKESMFRKDEDLSTISGR